MFIQHAKSFIWLRQELKIKIPLDDRRGDPPPSELDNGNLAVMYNTKQNKKKIEESYSFLLFYPLWLFCLYYYNKIETASFVRKLKEL